MMERLVKWLHKFMCFWVYEGIADCDDGGCIYEYRCSECGKKSYEMYRG